MKFITNKKRQKEFDEADRAGKTDHDRIYLTDKLGEITWCEDRITNDDEVYINEKLVKRLLLRLYDDAIDRVINEARH